MRAARSSVRGADPSLCPADSAERVVQRFTVPGVSNYTALLLSPDGGTLYLGAREVLFAVNTSHFQPGAPARRVSPCRAPQDHRAPGRAGGTEPKFGAGSGAFCSQLGHRGGCCPSCAGSGCSAPSGSCPVWDGAKGGQRCWGRALPAPGGVSGGQPVTGAPSDCPLSAAAVGCG